MAFVIFEVKAEDVGKINIGLLHEKVEYILDPLTSNDVQPRIEIIETIVSRQSVYIRDSSSLGLKGDFTYVKVEGSKEGIKKAEELAKKIGFKKLDEKKAKEINEKIVEQDDSAASGMGMIFD